MRLSTVLDLVAALSIDTTDFGRARYARLLALLAEKAPITGIIERLVADLKTRAGFAYTNRNLTSTKCPTSAEPSLDGARLERRLGNSLRASVLAELKSEGRRSATVAEGLLYGLTHPEALDKGWIWCLDQVVVIDGREYVLVLLVAGGDRFADLFHVSSVVGAFGWVLSFPMTPAELAWRDAEVAERRNA